MACPTRCGDDPARWLVLRVEGPERGTHAISFQCRACSRQRLQLADVEDLVAAVLAIGDRYQARRAVAYVDADEFHAYLLAEAWSLWLRWAPDRGVPFAGYLFRFLPLRCNEYYRSRLGRTGNKKLVPIGSAQDVTRCAMGKGERAAPGDPQVCSQADLRRLLVG